MSTIGYVVYYYVIDFIKLWLVLWGIFNFSAVKNKRVYAVIGVIEGIIVVVSSFYYASHTDTVVMFLAFLVILTVCLLFQGRFLKKLAYSLLAYLLLLFMDTCITAAISIILNMNYFNMNKIYTLKYICNTANVISVVAVILFKRLAKFPKYELRISKRVYTLLFAGVGSGVIILILLLVSSFSSTSSDRTRRVMLVIAVVVCLSYSGVCLMLIVISDSRDKFKTLSMINQSVIEAQQQYYMMVNEKQQEMRSIRHEMRNHLTCIYSLCAANKLTEMEQYINQLVEHTNNTEVLFETGSDIVNAILNDAQSRYRSEQICIRVTGGFPQELFIVPLDLCVIFANIISNAVEAIMQMERNEEEKYIDITIRSFKDDLFIDASNPTDQEVMVHDGYLISTKADKDRHGFGTKNIKQRVEKYRGEVTFRSENKYFYIEIQMKNRE